MTILKNYHHFDGRHWETGSIHNVLAYQGIPAPHTGKPLSEALLLGVSGGITCGYFTFEYKGYDPHIALLPRNTFNPLETIFERLAIPHEVLHTSKPEIGLKNLVDVLEGGNLALVWVDRFTVPYNLLPYDEKSWAIMPVVVYGIEGESVYIADCSSKPLVITTDELQKARGRVKDDKYRVMTLDAPNMDKLSAAVQKGIWQCISLYTDAPPKGKRENFGFAAMQHWADMLTNTRNKQSWERYFSRGSRLYAALAGDVVQPGTFDWICTWGAADGAERGLYADFLDEAAAILNKPDLRSAGKQFRKAAEHWCEFANTLLPDSVALFKETRDLKLRKHHLFIDQGIDACDDIQAINTRLMEIKSLVADDFPMSQEAVVELREQLREQLLQILDIEREAVEMMQAAV